MATDTLARVLALSAGSGGGGSDVVVVTADINEEEFGGPVGDIPLINFSKTASQISADYLAGKKVILNINFPEGSEYEYYIFNFKNLQLIGHYAGSEGEEGAIYLTFAGVGSYSAVGSANVQPLEISVVVLYHYEGEESETAIQCVSRKISVGNVVQYIDTDTDCVEYIRIVSELPSFTDDETLYFIPE